MIYAEALAALEPFMKSPPVQLGAAATSLGIKVYSGSMAPGISGKLYKSKEDGGPSGWAIIVNEADSNARQRFTIAHELGHFLLHRDEIGSALTDDAFYRSQLSDPQEWEANRFAADLLMPWPLIAQLTREGFTDLGDLARKLKVSEQAMRIRLGDMAGE